MAVVSEVAKGDTLPANPYLAGDGLHYYWLAHLFPALEHRALPHVPLDRLLLANALLAGMAFVGFLWLPGAHTVNRAGPARGQGGAAVLFTSFEGLGCSPTGGRMRRSRLRDLNIDAITRWVYPPCRSTACSACSSTSHSIGSATGWDSRRCWCWRRDRRPRAPS
ncbi:MAG: hypothetical protein R2708_24025 [Vicinamibacterales bacterium]